SHPDGRVLREEHQAGAAPVSRPPPVARGLRFPYTEESPERLVGLTGCARATVRRLVALAVFAAAHPAAAQSVSSHSFQPPVFSAGAPPQVLFAAEIAGQPSRVTLDFNPGQLGVATTLELHDDGQNGDRAAGDRVFSLLLPTANILNATRAD